MSLCPAIFPQHDSSQLINFKLKEFAVFIISFVAWALTTPSSYISGDAQLMTRNLFVTTERFFQTCSSYCEGIYSPTDKHNVTSKGSSAISSSTKSACPQGKSFCSANKRENSPVFGFPSYPTGSDLFFPKGGHVPSRATPQVYYILHLAYLAQFGYALT